MPRLTVSRAVLFLAAMALTIPVLWSQTGGFVWKMALVKSQTGKDTSLPFNRPVAFANGERFCLVIVPETAGMLTVFYEDTTGTVSAIFQGPIQAGQTIILPGDRQKFQVAPPGGTEKFHVAIGRQSTPAVDALVKALPGSSARLLDALAQLKTSLAAIAEAPEKPVPMGGTHRGLEDVTMTEFRGKDSYVKTIRFDH
jgi:hypothetical protein